MSKSLPLAVLIELNGDLSDTTIRDFLAWLQREAASQKSMTVDVLSQMRYDPKMGHVVIYQP